MIIDTVTDYDTIKLICKCSEITIKSGSPTRVFQDSKTTQGADKLSEDRTYNFDKCLVFCIWGRGGVGGTAAKVTIKICWKDQ